MKKKPLLFRKSTGQFEFKFIPRLDEEPPLEFAKDKIIKTGLFSAAVFLLVPLLYLAFKYSHLPNQLPLFYSRSWGEKQLAGKEMMFILPLGTMIILLVNFGLAKLFFTQERLLGRIVVWTSVAVSLLSGWTLVKIINLIT